MNKKERQTLLKILLIREEVSEKEFNNVLNFLSEEIANDSSLSATVKKEFSTKTRTRESIPILINKYKSEDSKKYNLLTKLYKSVQEATIFKGIPEIKLFVEKTGLKGVNGKSKGEFINQIFNCLMNLETNEIIKLVDENIEFSSIDKDKSYKKLSEFIMNVSDK